MKQNFFKTGALFSLIVLTFSSCFKDDLEEPVIPDPPSWSHSATWEETERKRGTADWETVPNSNRLKLWWNYTDNSKSIMVGAYNYKPTNFGISIDTAGYMQVKNALLSFIAIKVGGIKDTFPEKPKYVGPDTTVHPVYNIPMQINSHAPVAAANVNMQSRLPPMACSIK